MTSLAYNKIKNILLNNRIINTVKEKNEIRITFSDLTHPLIINFKRNYVMFYDVYTEMDDYDTDSVKKLLVKKTLKYL